MQDCPFCNMSKNPPKHLIYQDDLFYVIPDMDSLGFGHCMIIPNQHVEKIYELSDEVYAKLFNLAKKFSEILLKCTDKKTIGYVAYGSGLLHAHLHLVPHDTVDVLSNPCDYEKRLSEKELIADAKKIKLFLS
jgi:histidine triad (HIT) family protein